MTDVPVPDEGFDRGGHRPPRGYKWESFKPGNTVSVTHGCYSGLVIAPRAQEIREMIREQLSEADASRFDLLIGTSSAVGAQAERALLVLDAADDPENYDRLGKAARGWISLWMSSLKSLGLTPAAARDAARDAGQHRLAQHLETVYGGDVDADDSEAHDA